MTRGNRTPGVSGGLAGALQKVRHVSRADATTCGTPMFAQIVARGLLAGCLLAVVGPCLGEAYPRVDGVVRDKATKAPIAGAVVHLRTLNAADYSKQHGMLNWTTTTGADGRFTFPVVEHYEYPGAFYLRACKDGYVRYPEFVATRECLAGDMVSSRVFSTRSAFEKAVGVFLLGRDERTSVVIEMEKGGALEGTLQALTSSGVRPFTGSVSLYRQVDREAVGLMDYPIVGLAVDATPEGAVDVDSHGAFAFRDLPPSDRYYLIARAEDYIDERVDDIAVRAGETTQVERTLDQTDPTGVRGIITVAGIPAAAGSGRVSVKRQTAGTRSLTDLCGTRIGAGGTYECRGVRPGTYTVFCAVLGESQPYLSTKRTVQITAGQTISLDIDVPWGGR